MDGDYDDPGPDDTLSPSESLDSDEVRNDDGDIVVDPPDRWIDPREDESLDERLAAEEPDAPSGGALRERPARRSARQIDGTPEDGDSFFTVVDDDERQLVTGDDEADAIIED
ncbi:MAG: hypothetical protein AB7F42_03430 [Mycolicibacterium sp.]